MQPAEFHNDFHAQRLNGFTRGAGGGEGDKAAPKWRSSLVPGNRPRRWSKGQPGAMNIFPHLPGVSIIPVLEGLKPVLDA